MTDQPEDRGVLIGRLRRMADWLEHHPDLPLSPYASVDITAYTDDPLVAVRVMDEHPGDWTALEADSLIVHELDREMPWSVTYQVVLRKPKHAASGPSAPNVHAVLNGNWENQDA